MPMKHPSTNSSLPSQRETHAEAQRACASRDASKGALPSNTAPSNYIYPNGLILRQGVDSIYLSFSGLLDKVRDTQLKILKSAAQAKQDEIKSAAFIMLNGEEFYVHSTGQGRFKYVLKHKLLDISVSSSSSTSLPLASVQISSHWLAAESLENIISETAAFVSELGQLEGLPTLSRVDLFVDFVYPIPLDTWHSKAFVGRARKKEQYTDGTTPTGWMFGKGGALVFRLYDKTQELPEEKFYLKPKWKHAGWDGVSPVYRAEFQLRRSALKERNINTLPELLARTGSLWEYCTTSWIRLTTPSDTDKIQTRWPTHPLWTVVQSVNWDKNSYNDCSREVLNNPPSTKYLSQQTIGLVTSHMAIHNIHDPEESLCALWELARKYKFGNSANDKALVCEHMVTKTAVKARRFKIPYEAPCKKAQSHFLYLAKLAHERDQENDRLDSDTHS